MRKNRYSTSSFHSRSATLSTSKSHLVQRRLLHPRPGPMPCSSRLPAKYTGKHLRVEPPLCAPDTCLSSRSDRPLPPALLTHGDVSSTQSRSPSKSSSESPPALDLPLAPRPALHAGEVSGLESSHDDLLTGASAPWGLGLGQLLACRPPAHARSTDPPCSAHANAEQRPFQVGAIGTLPFANAGVFAGLLSSSSSSSRLSMSMEPIASDGRWLPTHPARATRRSSQNVPLPLARRTLVLSLLCAARCLWAEIS